jgi:hypothetical protein
MSPAIAAILLGSCALHVDLAWHHDCIRRMAMRTISHEQLHRIQGGAAPASSVTRWVVRTPFFRERFKTLADSSVHRQVETFGMKHGWEKLGIWYTNFWGR